MTTTWDYFK